MGFPIRKCPDQSLFAAPRTLSQRTTSFIASQRQGIHRIPLRHLIVLIDDGHPSRRTDRIARKTSLCKARPVIMRSGMMASSCTAQTAQAFSSGTPGMGTSGPNTLPLNNDKQHAHQVRPEGQTRPQTFFKNRMSWRSQGASSGAIGFKQTVWWSQTGSNRRPHACKARALPTELWPPLAQRVRLFAFGKNAPGSLIENLARRAPRLPPSADGAWSDIGVGPQGRPAAAPRGAIAKAADAAAGA